MHLATDYIHPTPRGGRCRMRVYLPDEERDAPVVICSELPTNEGSSITYAAEQLAARLAATLANSPEDSTYRNPLENLSGGTAN